MARTGNGFYVAMVIGIVFSSMVASCAANFFQEVDLSWGGNRGKIFNGGRFLSLSLDKFSGFGFQSKKQFLFGKLDANGRRRLRWVQKHFMIYNYCTDLNCFPQGLPPECKRSSF